MNVKTRIEPTADGSAWNLYVNGAPAMTYESYGVCCAVEAALLNRTSTGRFYSEAAEVADVILRRMQQIRLEVSR